MSEPTFEQKQDHYRKIRRSNWLASLRLERFDTQPTDFDKPLPTPRSRACQVPRRRLLSH